MSENGVVDGMLVVGDRVLAVGDADRLRTNLPPRVQMVDLKGRAVFPGFHDCHIHFLKLAVSRKQINLMGLATVDDALKVVAEAAAKVKPGAWLVGRGWDKSLWHEFPTRYMLDAVAPDVPVCLTSKCGHAIWVNSKALQVCGINRSTPVPEGGAILKDEDGEPTGILMDRASALVRQFIAQPTPDFLFEAAAELIPELWKMGITCIHAPDQIELFGIARKLRLERDLPMRVALMPPIADLRYLSSLGIHQGYGDDWVWTAQVKMFKDGALGSSTALLFEPYEHLPGYCGLDVMPLPEMTEKVGECIRAGYGVAVHAIGDRAVSETLDVIQCYAEQSRRLGLRHRIEHAQMVHPKDGPRFRGLDVIASVQPSHVVADRYMADREWGSRSNRAYPFKQLLDYGVRLAFGSDAPVDTPDPIYGLYCAINRNLPGEPEALMWHPKERIPVAEAVAAYTRNAAFAAGKESVIGDLSPGKYADFVVLSQDLFSGSPSSIASTKVSAVAIGGRFVVEPDWG